MQTCKMLNTTNKLQLQYYIHIIMPKQTTVLIIYIISHIHMINISHFCTNLIAYLYAILLRVVVDTHNVPSMQNAQHLAHATRAT